MDSLTHQSPLTRSIFDTLAYLAPDNLPEQVLTPLAGTPDILDALRLLASYSMINRTDGLVSVHRLVQAVP